MTLHNRMRILLTENCNANCEYCFNKDIRETKEMSKDKAKIMLDMLSQNGVKIIKIMGGEPTVHSSFLEMYNLMQQKFELVYLFTNSLNDEILKIKPRVYDSITYNLLFIHDDYNFQKLLPERSFKRSFEVVIHSNVDADLVIHKIKLISNKKTELGNKDIIRFNLTLDCTEDIFKLKNKICSKYWKILRFLKQFRKEYVSFDHNIPKCFWPKELREELKEFGILSNRTICNQSCAGLINSNFEIAHCNQLPAFRENLFETKNGKEQIISFQKLRKIIMSSNLKKISYVLNTHCINCEHSLDSCNGGCMMHKFDKTGNLHKMDDKYFDMFR